MRATCVVPVAIVALLTAPAGASQLSLRFYGHSSNDVGRVKIPIDAPARPVDVGAGDFTIELWMKAAAGANGAGGCNRGTDGWIFGNIVLDRDVYGAGDYGDYGLALFADGLGFGVADAIGGNSVCGATRVADGRWHHVAVTRSVATGDLRLYVDGRVDASARGPVGNVSYRDRRPTNFPQDPFLVIGSEKHSLVGALSFNGWIDELRVSNVVRYTGPFSPPGAPFVPGAGTVALYHFDEGPAGACTGAVVDSSGAIGGPSHGQCRFGGAAPAGPVYSTDTPSFAPPSAPPIAPSGCGDGIIDPGEGCDDGNGVGGDGCEPDCTSSSYVLLPGTHLLVRDHATNPTRRRLAVSSRAPTVPTLPRGAVGDPTIDDSELRLARGTAEVAVLPLPRGHWRGLGSPPGTTGWQYRDPKRVSGPCTKVTVRSAKRLTASCRGARLAFTLDEPAQGALTVVLRPGAAATGACLYFGGEVSRDVSTAANGTGVFEARNAPAPPSCPLP